MLSVTPLAKSLRFLFPETRAVPTALPGIVLLYSAHPAAPYAASAFKLTWDTNIVRFRPGAGDNWLMAWVQDDWSGTNRTYHHKLPPKFMSADGRTLWLVYCGLDGPDYTFCAQKTVVEDRSR